MKKINVFTVLLFTSFYSYSQNAAIETEIKGLEQKVVQAILQKDSATLRKLWAPGFIVNAPTNRVVTGGQVEMVIAGAISYSVYTKEIEKILINGDLVITMGNETVVPAIGKPRAGQTIKRRYTNIWLKENGSWITIARHASEICQP
ncbi:MAG: nuclear transport factor 2 family protein [Chitinophagaceae bacterium]